MQLPSQTLHTQIRGRVRVQYALLLRPERLEHKVERGFYIFVLEVLRRAALLGDQELQGPQELLEFLQKALQLRRRHWIAAEVELADLRGLAGASGLQKFAGFRALDLQYALFSAALGADQ
jgi:hypothetical protein